MTAARLGRLLLVVAFLAAQSAAVSHQIWHAGSGLQAETTQPEQPGKKDSLCDFHAALGTVLGALGGEHQLAQPAPLGAIAFVITHSTPRSSAPLSPSSRDPPPLS